jgi:hypothetical protein
LLVTTGAHAPVALHEAVHATAEIDQPAVAPQREDTSSRRLFGGMNDSSK